MGHAQSEPESRAVGVGEDSEIGHALRHALYFHFSVFFHKKHYKN